MVHNETVPGRRHVAETWLQPLPPPPATPRGPPPTRRRLCQHRRRQRHGWNTVRTKQTRRARHGGAGRRVLSDDDWLLLSDTRDVTTPVCSAAPYVVRRGDGAQVARSWEAARARCRRRWQSHQPTPRRPPPPPRDLVGSGGGWGSMRQIDSTGPWMTESIDG